MFSKQKSRNSENLHRRLTPRPPPLSGQRNQTFQYMKPTAIRKTQPHLGHVPGPARTPESNVENIQEEIKFYLSSALELFGQLPSRPKTTGHPGTQSNGAQTFRVVVPHGTPQLPRPPVKFPTLSVHNSDKLPSFSAKHAEEIPSDVEQSLLHEPSKFTINGQINSSPQPQQVIGLHNNDDTLKQSPSLEEHHTNVIPSPFCPVPVSSQSHSQSSPLQGSSNIVKESSQAKPRDLTVSAQLNGQSIKALVDTGATISVIDKEVLKDVYKEQFPKLQTDNLDLKTVSGKALPVLGMFTTALDIANGSYSCIFLVDQDLPYDAVLGRDFLRENGAIINLKESTLQLDGKRDEPYPERELGQGLSCDQSPVQSTRRKEFTEEHSATEKTPIKQSRASRKRALPSDFIGTLFFPSASDDTNVTNKSYRRS